MDFDVVVVGSCCMDLISYVPHLPKPGETVHGYNFITACGGKGANQSVMASRLGATVAMVAKVGNGTFGRDSIDNFAANSVTTDFVQQTGEAATGVVLITVDREGKNSFISIKGANDLLTSSDVEKALDHIKSTKVVVSEMEIRPEPTLMALTKAKECGYITVLNPSPAISNLNSEFYRVSDIIILNQMETELLTGIPVTDVDETKTAASILLARGCQNVIITLGKDGAVLVTRENKTPEHIPVAPVTPIDTTGAGDSFIGSLAFYLARFPWLPLTEVVRRSNRIAAVTVLSSGTQLSYPWRRDIPAELFA